MSNQGDGRTGGDATLMGDGGRLVTRDGRLLDGVGEPRMRCECQSWLQSGWRVKVVEGRADAEMPLEVRAIDECCCSERGTSCFGDSVSIFKFEIDVLPADERKKAVARSQNVGEVRRLCGVL